MTNKIDAIPTTYNGITYRSRLEARWAVFLDSIGVKADYEQNGYFLGEAKLPYLPDFYVHDFDCYIEVKPKAPTDEEANKARQLAIAKACVVIIVVGSPSDKLSAYVVFDRHGNPYPDEEALGGEIGFRFASCRRCERLALEYQGKDAWGWQEFGEFCGNPKCGDRSPITDGAVGDAVNKARNERFVRHLN